MLCDAIYPHTVKGDVRGQNQWYPMEWHVVHCLSQSYTAVLDCMTHNVLTINPKRVQTTSICFCLQFKKSWFGPFLDPSVSVIWTIHRKWWWMARWFKLITAHSWWPRSAALRLQVEHKRPALDDGHKQPPGLITFLTGKLVKLLKIEKGNCCYHFILRGSPTLDQEASSHIYIRFVKGDKRP